MNRQRKFITNPIGNHCRSGNVLSGLTKLCWDFIATGACIPYRAIDSMTVLNRSTADSGTAISCMYPMMQKGIITAFMISTGKPTEIPWNLDIMTWCLCSRRKSGIRIAGLRYTKRPEPTLPVSAPNTARDLPCGIPIMTSTMPWIWAPNGIFWERCSKRSESST